MSKYQTLGEYLEEHGLTVPYVPKEDSKEEVKQIEHSEPEEGK